MKISVVINPGSGTLCDTDLGQLRGELSSALSQGNHEIISWHQDETPVDESLNLALQHNPDCLMIGGGDGSVSAAAKVAWAENRVLAVLPGGTMNLYARTLGLPLAIDDCVAAYSNCRVIDVDVATADEHLFLHQFTVGLHARAVRLRNTMSYGSRFSKVFASIKAFTRTVFNPPRLKVDLIIDGQYQSTRTVSALSVTNNQLGEGHIPYADRPDGGVLGVYYSDPIRFGAAIKLVIDTLRGTAERNNENLHSMKARKVRIDFPGRRKRHIGMIDGELAAINKTLSFDVHPASLRMLVPNEANNDHV